MFERLYFYAGLITELMLCIVYLKSLLHLLLLFSLISYYNLQMDSSPFNPCPFKPVPVRGRARVDQPILPGLCVVYVF